MLDIKFIRENTDLIKDAILKKNVSLNLDDLIVSDAKRRSLLQEIESLKAEQNKSNKLISQVGGLERDELLSKMKEISITIKQQQEELKKVEEMYQLLMLKVPNIIHPDVPVGKNEDENVVGEVVGEVIEFDFKPKDHVELMKKHDMIDVERGVKLGGSRSYFLKNDAVLLEQAVLQYAFRKMIQKGFTPLQVPYIVSPKTLVGTGYFPGGEDDAYHLERDDKWLVATAEIPVTAYYSEEIIPEEELPKTFVALSPCFRREAGSYGKDTTGLYRVHQFNKVEQVIVLPADEKLSNEWHYNILQNSREVLDELEIPYRVLNLCTGDLALGKYLSHDLECYMPSREGYGETHSATSFLDFQARRLKMRYKTKDGEIKYCYTLNNTVIASPRILIALIENYQQKDGSILVPKVLQEYVGKEIIK